jgi:hypothetical protein
MERSGEKPSAAATSSIAKPAFSDRCHLTMEAIMAGHEDKRSHSVAKIAFDAVADWITRYRRSLKFNSELEAIDPDQVAVMAKDIGITAGQLRELASKRDATAALRSLLVTLDVNPKEFDKIDPRIARDMQWLCINCSNKAQCSFDLSIGIAAATFCNFCPNAMALDEIFGVKPKKATIVNGAMSYY